MSGHSKWPPSSYLVSWTTNRIWQLNWLDDKSKDELRAILAEMCDRVEAETIRKCQE